MMHEEFIQHLLVVVLILLVKNHVVHHQPVEVISQVGGETLKAALHLYFGRALLAAREEEDQFVPLVIHPHQQLSSQIATLLRVLPNVADRVCILYVEVDEEIGCPLRIEVVGQLQCGLSEVGCNQHAVHLLLHHLLAGRLVRSLVGMDKSAVLHAYVIVAYLLGSPVNAMGYRAPVVTLFPLGKEAHHAVALLSGQGNGEAVRLVVDFVEHPLHA